MKQRFFLYAFANASQAIKDIFPNAANPGGPLDEVLAFMARSNCETILLQSPVQDPDFAAEYAAYYSKLFREIDRYCTRLHFFSRAHAPNTDPFDFIDQASQEANCYLGFATIRPLASSPVGATILRTPSNGDFILCHEEFPVHIAGQKFSVRGTPFMQQDNAVGACAQASIWMALRTLRKRIGNSAFDPAQITNAATRFLVSGRTMPGREGLSMLQMAEAVRSSGHVPYLLTFREPDLQPPPGFSEIVKRRLYTYVESEIPVILGLYSPGSSQGHAVVLIGHDWNAAGNGGAQAIQIPMAGLAPITALHAVDWVPGFFIHNDNAGPYQNFTSRNGNQTYALEDVTFAIPLLPSDVLTSAEEAEATAIRVAGEVLTQIAQRVQLNNPFVFRTYLIRRSEFRKRVLTSSMSPSIKKYYRNKFLPKHIWVTEINDVRSYNLAANGQAACMGEIVFDPTDDPLGSAVLSVHVRVGSIPGMGVAANIGVRIDRDPSTGAIDIAQINDETDYYALTR